MNSQRREVDPTRRRGIAAVFSVVMMLVLLGFGALTVDVGLLQLVRAELQRTADSAALAAAQDLDALKPFESMQIARESALQFTKLNPVLNRQPVQFQPDRDIEFGLVEADRSVPSLTFTSGGFPLNAVRVTVHYEVHFVLAKIFGVNSKVVSASALSAVPPPLRADVIPSALPAPGFGVVNPTITNHNPGKTSPSEPANGRQFMPGEEVAVFFFGNGPRQQVHLVLDITGGQGVADINAALETADKLTGEQEPYSATIGEELPVWGGKDGTGNQNFGEKLETRLTDGNPETNKVILPIVSPTENMRNADGEIDGPVRISDFVAVKLTEIRNEVVSDPDGNPMTVRVMYANVIELPGGSGNGLDTTSGQYTLGSVKGAPLLLR